MIFNGIEKEYLTVLRGRNRPAWAPIIRELITVPKMTGAHLSYSQVQVRKIDVPVFIMADSFPDLQKLKEDMAEWLIHDEPEELIFKDEPDRTYYAVVDGGIELDELIRWGEGVITFLCPDPYKYGEEKTIDFTDDTVIIENAGSAPAKPIIELTAKEKSTFAMVTLGDEQFNIIGQPADDDVQIVDSRTSVLYENGSTIGDWQVATSQMVDEHFIKDIGGNMTTDGVGIRADGYGTGDALHGPAVFKEIDPIQNFQIYSVFGMNSTRPIESWRMGINFLDENLNMLGHMGIKDNSRVYKRRTPLARYGPYRGSGRENGNLIGDSRKMDNTRDLTLFHLRANRVGNVFEFFIGYWLSHRFAESWTERYIDINNEFNGRLKYITLYIATHSDRPTPSMLRINSVEVFELATIQQDQTPYIIYPGDVVTFDHVNADVLLNGELSKDNFFGDFFELEKGQNHLTITPEDTFDTKITYKERFK